MTTQHTLVLLRHAEASDSHPGGRDVHRMLTALGKRQARGVGDFLRSQGIKIDAVICSSAVRARETLDQLRTLAEECAVTLLIGHAPGVPGVAFELSDPETRSHRR